MKALIYTLTGKRIIVDCEPGDSIEDVKKKIEDKEGYLPEFQSILVNRTQPGDGRNLVSC